MAELGEDDFGLSPNEFKQMRENLEAEPVSKYSIKWKGQNTTLDVYRISIKHLRYNLFNTRIKPHLIEFIAKNSLEDDHFEVIDRDSLSTQKMVNNFLRKNPDRKDALKFFKDPNNFPEIQEPLVSTIDGRVLNGNQRLCCFRQLYNTDQRMYGHLQTAFVAFLPDNGTAEDERNLEATFQETKLAAVPFDWIQSGLWAIEERKKGVSATKIGKTLGIKEAQVNLDIQIIKFAEDFLEYSGQAKFWHTLREMQLKQAFMTLAAQFNKLKSRSDREKLKQLCFKIMLEPKESGKAADGKSVHLLIGDIARNLDDFEIEGQEEEEVTQPHDFLAGPVKTKTAKKKREKVNLSSIKATTLAKKAADQETIRKAKHQASLDENFAVRQMKVCKTTLENIVEKWDKQKTDGLEDLVDEAIEYLNTIKNKLQTE
jgi:hypothetical protein